MVDPNSVQLHASSTGRFIGTSVKWRSGYDKGGMINGVSQ